MQSTEKIETTLRETGDKNNIKWANLMQKVRTRIRYGQIELVLRDGMIDKIKNQTEYDDCSSGL